MQKSDEVILIWLTAGSNPSTVLDNSLTWEWKYLVLDKALSTLFRIVNNTSLARLWDVNPCDLTTSGNILSAMLYRLHHFRLCFGWIQTLHFCLYCTIFAGERNHSAPSSFRTDRSSWSLRTGDDLSHFPVHPFGRQGRFPTEGTGSSERADLSVSPKKVWSPDPSINFEHKMCPAFHFLNHRTGNIFYSDGHRGEWQKGIPVQAWVSSDPRQEHASSPI